MLKNCQEVPIFSPFIRGALFGFLLTVLSLFWTLSKITFSKKLRKVRYRLAFWRMRSAFSIFLKALKARTQMFLS